MQNCKNFLYFTIVVKCALKSWICFYELLTFKYSYFRCPKMYVSNFVCTRNFFDFVLESKATNISVKSINLRRYDIYALIINTVKPVLAELKLIGNLA